MSIASILSHTRPTSRDATRVSCGRFYDALTGTDFFSISSVVVYARVGSRFGRDSPRAGATDEGGAREENEDGTHGTRVAE